MKMLLAFVTKSKITAEKLLFYKENEKDDKLITQYKLSLGENFVRTGSQFKIHANSNNNTNNKNMT